MTKFEDQARAWICNEFPEFAERLAHLPITQDQESSQDQIDFCDDLIEAAQLRVQSATTRLEVPQGPSKGGTILLRQSQAAKLISARGDQIKTEVTALLQALKDAHDAKHQGAAAMSALLVPAGILAVTPAGNPTPPAATLIEEAIEDADASTEAEIAVAEEDAAELAAVAIGPEVLAALLVLLAVIIILWFLFKDANCYVIILNESDSPVSYRNEYGVHGKPGAVAAHNPGVATVKTKHAGDRKYMSAGVFEFHRKNNFHGTQYGWTVENQGRQIAFGVECPLTGKNTAYVHFGQSAKQAAEAVNNSGRDEVSTKDAKGRAQLRGSSPSGSPAFYIGRVT